MADDATQERAPKSISAVTDLGYELYRDLYFSERQRRETIRGSIAVPTAALAFSIYSLSMLATQFDLTRWHEPFAIAIGLLSLLATGLLIVAAANIGRVEWMFVYHDPPDLEALVKAEDQARRELGDWWLEDGEGKRQLRGVLTASFYIAYGKYFAANQRSARRRTLALRQVLAALVSLALAFALLPAHLAGR
jgi:hypothetical protein